MFSSLHQGKWEVNLTVSTQKWSQAPPTPTPLAPQDPYQGYVIQDEPSVAARFCEVIGHLSGDQLSG